MQQLDIYYQHLLNMFRASLCPFSGEQDVCYCTWCAAVALLDVVGIGCSHPTTQRPTTDTNHIQQYQRSTPRAVTHVLVY